MNMVLSSDIKFFTQACSIYSWNFDLIGPWRSTSCVGIIFLLLYCL